MEINYTFCDNCNLDYNNKKTFFLPSTIAQVVNPDGTTEGTLVERGFFIGSMEEAKAAGWAETEYGHACPLCLFEQKQVDESGETVIGLEQLYEVVNGQNAENLPPDKA